MSKTALIGSSEGSYHNPLFSPCALCLTPALDFVSLDKVWDDCSMWNVDFSNVCQKGPRCLLSFSLKRLNELEVALLKCINFNVRVSVSDYTACYFHLQSVKLSKQDGVDKTVPVADSSSKISPHEVRQRSNSRRSDAASSERYTS